MSFARTRVLSSRTLGLLTFLLIASGCSQHPSPSTNQYAHNWSTLGPLDMLREAGRIVCDADTFEAVGTRVGDTISASTDPIPLHWVFGPNGEFRFEHGSIKVIFNIAYIYGTNGADWNFLQKEHPESEFVTPYGPHNRASGDMIMATGMPVGGMTFPTAAARLAGKDWPEACFWAKGMTCEFQRDEVILNRPCKRIVVSRQGQDGAMTFWIDMEFGVIRKWESRGRQSTDSVQFDLIRLNGNLDSTAFEIPRAVLEEHAGDDEGHE